MSLSYIDREMRVGDQGSSMNDIEHLFGKRVCFNIIFDTALKSKGSS